MISPKPSSSPIPSPSLSPIEVIPPPPKLETSPVPDSYNIDYQTVKNLVGLADQLPERPRIPEKGYINGTNNEFTATITREQLYTLQKVFVENTVFDCQTPNMDDWRTIGAHNVYTNNKYGVDNYSGPTVEYHNMLIENPFGLYNSQRDDLKKVENFYCKDGKKVMYLP